MFICTDQIILSNRYTYVLPSFSAFSGVLITDPIGHLITGVIIPAIIHTGIHAILMFTEVTCVFTLTYIMSITMFLTVEVMSQPNCIINTGVMTLAENIRANHM